MLNTNVTKFLFSLSLKFLISQYHRILSSEFCDCYMSFPSFLKIITKQGLIIICLSKLLCLSFSFKIAFQQLFSVHVQACDHVPWLVCGANLQGQLARVGSFYPVGSQGAISGWQA